jgi:putative tryptophan/tyrosine transport system substrate-binding protein
MRLSTFGLLVTFGIGLLWTPLVATAQQPRKVYRIGFLVGGSPPPPSAAQLRQSPFWQAMHELGWVEGQNITVERRYAEGHNERLRILATELVQLPVDVILAQGPREARAAKAASDTIPIVFIAAGDPVRAGLVASLAHPGGNMTGLSAVSPELSEKRLELLKEAAPGISRVAVLTNADVNYLLPEMTHTAQGLGVTLYPINVPAADQLDPAVAVMMTARAEALLVLSAPLFIQQWRRVVALAAASRLPTLYPSRYFVAAGGLMSYGPSELDMSRRAATYVDKILKGAKPADLPVEQPTKFEFVINLKTAQALGLTIPPPLLFLADEVIR